MKTLLRPKMSSEKKPNIETIPQEILTEILEHLDWQDILRVRLACKRLHQASTAKSIWTGLIATHQYKVSPSFTFLDKPIKLHTSKELEQLFLRWKRVELSWLRSPPELKTSLLYTPRRSSPRDIHLLRGGRWLLCSDNEGYVWYYDLNIRRPDYFFLCPTPLPGNFIRWNAMAVDEDWESPILSFHLATCCGPYFRDYSWLDVWHGRLVLDDRNQPAGLQAERLARLPLSPDLGRPHSLSLFGDRVAYIELTKHEIVIINWKDPGKELQHTRKILFPDTYLHDTTLRLLPQDLLMSKGRRDISIFDYSQIPEGASKPDSSVQVAHLPDRQCSCDLIPSSNPSQLVYCNDRGVYEYNPRPAAALGKSKLEPSLLFKWPRSFRPSYLRTAHFSHNHGVFEDSDNFFFVRYSSPDEHDGLPTGISQRDYHALGRSLSIQMSPYSGKIVCMDVACHLWLSDVLEKVEEDW